MQNNQLKGFNRLFLLAMLLLATVTLCLFDLTSFDLWLHLRTGKLVLDQQAFPHTDPFSYTVNGKPWVAHEWLFGVIFYLLYQLGGHAILVLSKVLLILATMYLVLHTNKSENRNYLLTVVLFFAAILLSRFRLLLRPHLFSLLFLALYYFAYERWRAGGKLWGLVFPLTMIFWANVHAGSIFGLVFLGLMLAGEILELFLPVANRAALLRRQLGSLMVLLLLTILASLVNPYGVHVLLLPFTLKNMQQIPHLKLVEWVPFSLSEKPYLYSYVTLLSIWIIARFRRLSWTGLLWYGFCAFLFISARRGVPYWALLTIPLFELSFKKANQTSPESAGWSRFALTQVVGLTMVIIGTVIALLPSQIYRIGLGIRDDKLPTKAVDFIQREGIEGRMFNSYRFGGYLIWRLFDQQLVFFDGRASLYRDIFKYRSQYTTEQLIDYFNSEYLIVDYQESLPFSLAGEPDSDKWALVFFDDAVRLYLKRIPRFSKVISEYEYQLIKPTDKRLKFLAADEGSLEQLAAEVARASSASPFNFRAQLFQTALFYAQGKPAEAEEILNKAITKVPVKNTVYYTLAVFLNQIKQDQTALRYLQLAMRQGFQDWVAYELLGNIYATAKDYQKAIAAYQEGLKQTDNFRLNYFLGYTYLQEKRYKLAREHLVKAYQYEPKNNRTWEPLAQIYTFYGELEQASRFHQLIVKQAQPTTQSAFPETGR